jgi:hypothetical protein
MRVRGLKLCGFSTHRTIQLGSTLALIFFKLGAIFGISSYPWTK